VKRPLVQLINHFIEDIVTKNIDSHFFQNNEDESNNNNEEDNKSNSDLNSEDFFKLKADEDKVSEVNLDNDKSKSNSKSNIHIKTNNSNNNNEQIKTNADIIPTESQKKDSLETQIKTSIIDEKLNDKESSKIQIQEDIRSNEESKTN